MSVESHNRFKIPKYIHKYKYQTFVVLIANLVIKCCVLYLPAAQTPQRLDTLRLHCRVRLQPHTFRVNLIKTSHLRVRTRDISLLVCIAYWLKLRRVYHPNPIVSSSSPVPTSRCQYSSKTSTKTSILYSLYYGSNVLTGVVAQLITLLQQSNLGHHCFVEDDHLPVAKVVSSQVKPKTLKIIAQLKS